MKANELRIGNWASIYGTNGWADEFKEMEISQHHFQVCESHPDWFKDIPLTSEWLERFGFEDVDEYYYHEGMRIYDDGDGKLYYMSNDALVHLDYVHQLQNLYFALTGEELTYG